MKKDFKNSFSYIYIFLCNINFSTVNVSFEDIESHLTNEVINSFVQKFYISNENALFESDILTTKGAVADIINRFFGYVEFEDNGEKK